MRKNSESRRRKPTFWRRCRRCRKHANASVRCRAATENHFAAAHQALAPSLELLNDVSVGGGSRNNVFERARDGVSFWKK